MRLGLFFTLAAAWAAPAHADLTATYVSVNAGIDFRMKIEIAANGDLRADTSTPGMYMIKRAGRAYFIVQEPSGPVVEDVADVGAVTQEELARLDPHFCDKWVRIDPSPKLVSQGTVTIAGRDGEAYGPEGHTGSRPAVVISRDPALTPLAQAMAAQFRMTTTVMGTCMPAVPMFAQMQALLDSGAPLLFGPARLDSVETGPIDPARFVLPGAPATREQVRALMARKNPVTVRVEAPVQD
jgi:hypothetical protein